MSIKITTDIRPADDQDTYALMDAKFLKGGAIEVDTASDLAADSTERREGRLYFVKDENRFYRYDSSDSTHKPINLVGANDKQVADNTAEINRLKTDLTTIGLGVFSWRDKGVPTIPTNKQYKAYYIHITVLPDNAQVIQIPPNVPDGAIFSVENNDRDDYVNVRPPAGETINGNSVPYQAGHDTLSYFVKNGTDWILAYGGVFPNNLTALKSTIQVLLPNELNTPDEIAAQLKDRLHTFREIQTEFANQMHTIDSLRQAGFIQRECEYGFYALGTVPSDRAWIVGTHAMDSPFTVHSTAAERLLLLMPAIVSSFIKKLMINDAETEFSINDFPTSGNDGTQKLLTTNDPVPANADLKIWFEWGYDASAISGGGVELDDGTSDQAGIRKINLKGMKLTAMPGQGGLANDETQLTSGINWHMQAPNQQYGSALANEVTILPPLNTYSDPNVTDNEGIILEIKPGTFEPLHKPSFLAYLKENEDVVGKIPSGYELTQSAHHHGAIWFDDIIVPAGAYIETRMVEKSYGIQEADELDPNVSGGTDYLIAARIHLKGTAPSAGFVRLYLYNSSIDPFNPTGYLLDVEGQPMAVEKHYKPTEELGVLDIIGIVNAKGLQEFTVHVVDNFTDDVIELTDRTEGASGVMIQAISSEEKTGLALLQFENDTNQNIEFSGHFLGSDRMGLEFIVARPDPVVSYTAGTNWVSVDGWRLINPRGLKVGVASDNHLHIQDDGAHICDFNFGKVFSAEETKMLRNKQVDVTVTLIDKNAGFTVALMKWTGKPDEFTPEIFTARDGGGSPTLQANWAIVDRLFISEDAITGDHSEKKTFTVPTDANNYAVIIYPVEAQQPVTLKLKEFELDVTTPFNGYILRAPEMLNEIHLELSDSHKRFVQDTQGYAALRYTINTAADGLPMPAGIPKSGLAPVELDASVNKVAGSNARGGEGALKFTEDGRAKISTIVRIWNEQGTDNTVTFWWAEVSPDGNTYTKLVDSEFSVTAPANSKDVVHRFIYSHDFEKDDRIALRASANKADGAFLNCVSDSRPMVDTAIEFERLIAGSGDDPDLISAPYDRKLVVDNRVIPFSGISAQNFEFDINIPADVEIGAHSVVGMLGGNVVSIDNSEFSYNPTTHKMTVHVGTFTEGKIYLTLWG